MTGKRSIWQVKKADQDKSRQLAAALGVLPVTASILLNKGITTPEEAQKFLSASLADLQNPNELPNLRAGARRIKQAIVNGENILIYGDYDVDGITGTVLLADLLRRLGGKVNYYIPNRMEEGYGLNKEALVYAKETSTDLIVTVDCGISSVAEAALIIEMGMDLVITDHHQLPEQLPTALAVINPKLAEENKPWYDLSGVGVAFKVGQAVASLFSQESIGEEYLDLVALGTIADIVPLRDENRILAKAGLERINNNQCRPGLQGLLKQTGLKGKKLTSGHVGFILAPRLNACGRLGKADLAVRLFLSNDLHEIEDICRILEEENITRRQVEEKIYQEALERLAQEEESEENKLIFLSAPNWHPGVIGIVASRLTEKYYRPTILLNLEEGIGRGSARSIPGFDLYQALEQVKEDLCKFGGHEMAAGLTLSEEKIPVVQKSLQEYACAVLDEKSLTPKLHIDAEVAIEEINEQLVEEIQLLGPFGHGNPAPLFVLRNGCLAEVRKVGQEGKHLKLKVRAKNKQIDAIAFNCGEIYEEVGEWIRCDLVFQPQLNTYKGVTRVQMQLQDLKNSVQPDDPYATLSFLEQLYLDGEIWLEDDSYRDILTQEQFYTKVVGVTYEDRQKLIREITVGESVELRREPHNPYDRNAIAVYFQKQMIGYLKAPLARNLAPALDQGSKYEAVVTQITGRDQDCLGVNICLRKIAEDNKSTEKKEAEFFCREQLADYSFAQIEEKIRQTILGSAEYYEKQKEALEFLQAGENTLLILATGRGKSAVFQSMAARLALLQNKATIIVYPLRSLVNDQYHRLCEKMSLLGVQVSAVNGSLSRPEREQFFADLQQGKVEIILTTPEFLAFHIEKFKAIKDKIGLLVVDEAHHLAKSKRKGYRLLGKNWAQLGNPLVLAVTATANNETAQHISDVLCCKKMVVENYVRKNLQVVDQRTEKDKLKYLLELVASGERIVIYVNSRKQAYQLASDLRLYYPAARDEIGFYHGGLYSEYRTILERMFREGELRVMVTTSAFGEGIDIPDIKHVVLYHLCFSLTEFNQLSGRAGRNNEEAKIHLLFNESDRKLNELILESAAPSRAVLGKFYLYLREECEKKGNPLLATNEELAQAMLKFGLKNLKQQTVSVCLGILEDIGLLRRETEGKQRCIYLLPPPSQKLNLADSLRYLEGQDEWEEFRYFAEFALKEEKEVILERINRPLVPVEAV